MAGGNECVGLSGNQTGRVGRVGLGVLAVTNRYVVTGSVKSVLVEGTGAATCW